MMKIKPASEFDWENPIPGVYSDVPDEIYHMCKLLSASRLKILMEGFSPAHVQAAMNEDKSDEKPSDAKIDGTLIHAATLEPVRFKAEYVEMPEDINLRTKAGKATRDELYKKHGQYRVYKKVNLDLARACAKAIHAHPTGKTIVEGGYHELTIIWVYDGMMIKSRIDHYDEVRSILNDLKSSKDLRERQFKYDAKKYFYPLQMVIYRAALLWAGAKVDQVNIVACEKKGHIGVRVFFMYNKELERLWNEIAVPALDQMAFCTEMDFYPSYDQEPVALLDADLRMAA